LITGFGPFGEVADNPSGELARTSGHENVVLPVSFRAVDEFIDSLVSNPPEVLLMLGVAAKRDSFSIELVARNLVGALPDVEGMAYGPGPLDPAVPFQLGTTLWRAEEFLSQAGQWSPSADAGDYLCNYIYFRALQKLPDSRVGFLHVPPYSVLDLSGQRDVFGSILERL